MMVQFWRITTLADPAVFITNKEYFKKHKKSLNVQSEVNRIEEKP